MYASLYFQMGRLGFAPDQVDRMEVWQAASILGVAEPPADDGPADGVEVGVLRPGMVPIEPVRRGNLRRAD